MTDNRQTGKNETLVSLFYRDFYQAVFNSPGLVGWAYRKTHRDLEAGFPDASGQRILEIGAGSGEHLEFCDSRFDQYVMVDLSAEPANPLWKSDKRVSWVQGDVCQPMLLGEKFDRIVSMCVLHHVHDLQGLFTNIKEWLKPSGSFSFFLSSDPGLLNRLNRRVFITPRAHRLGFPDYAVLNAREHHNHFWGIREEIHYAFQGFSISARFWPFGLPIASLSTYSIWNVSLPERLAEK